MFTGKLAISQIKQATGTSNNQAKDNHGDSPLSWLAKGHHQQDQSNKCKH